MTEDKDPHVGHPDRPDPVPQDDPDPSPTGSDGRRRDAGVTEQAMDEADEPVENRFPDEASGEQRESG